MATKSFLSDSDIEWALAQLKPANSASAVSSALAVSWWLGQKLEAKLAQHPRWCESLPLRLGSWARDELCLQSDIDLLFLGAEEAVQEIVSDLQKSGIKIRARLPEDSADWTIGVEGFDVLSLLFAQPFVSSSESKCDWGPLRLRFDEQVKRIASRGALYKRNLLKSMFNERKDRVRRYDSIANYLEPNLKYGPGGLRDIEQALMTARLFPDLFVHEETVLTRLRDFKNYLLLIRHWLHLHGQKDIVLAAHQTELATFFAYSNATEFMSDVEFTLSEANFFIDWVFDRALHPPHKRSASHPPVRQKPPTISPTTAVTVPVTMTEALNRLSRDPSISTQKEIRDQLSSPRMSSQRLVKKGGRSLSAAQLTRVFHADMSEELLSALFHSKFLARLVPDLERVSGLVQHDQYHRYSVDAHSFQAMREVLRMKKRPKLLGALAGLAHDLNKKDWDILLWTALFHDLGKGLAHEPSRTLSRDASGSDHSTRGAQIADRQLKTLGFAKPLREQVVWMVQNHLLMSTAAFRRDPQDPTVWSELFTRGLKDERIARLAIFTAIDIRATNLDAWNDWKAQLLQQLAAHMLAPPAHSLNDFLEFAQKKTHKKVRPHAVVQWASQLDSAVIERVSKSQLLDDYNRLVAIKYRSTGQSITQSADLQPLVTKNRRNEVWVRLHSWSDRSGLFLEFAQYLLSLGLNVREAFIQTFADFGAYDWFHVKGHISLAQLNQRVRSMAIWRPPTPSFSTSPNDKSPNDKSPNDMSPSDKSPSATAFSVIELISENDHSSIVSFRGYDRRGALAAAAQMIFAEGFEIKSAKVHTWGRQIEDVFTLKKSHPTDQRVSDWLKKVTPKRR